jgi:hypothetical protein
LFSSGVAFLAACGSSADPTPPESVTRWPAGALAQERLGVERWEVSGSVEQGELFGRGSESVRVHARLEQDTGGGFVIDFDVPEPWRLAFRPDRLPVVSGDIPADVELALATSALDAPVSSAASGPTATTILSPKDEKLIDPSSECIYVTLARPLYDSDAYWQVAARASDLLASVPGCLQKDNTFPDPDDPKEAKAYADCQAAVRKAGCDPDLLYQKVLEGLAHQAQLANPK